jgi:hypothetical protein
VWFHMIRSKLSAAMPDFSVDILKVQPIATSLPLSSDGVLAISCWFDRRLAEPDRRVAALCFIVCTTWSGWLVRMTGP